MGCAELGVGSSCVAEAGLLVSIGDPSSCDTTGTGSELSAISGLREAEEEEQTVLSDGAIYITPFIAGRCDSFSGIAIIHATKQDKQLHSQTTQTFCTVFLKINNTEQAVLKQDRAI